MSHYEPLMSHLIKPYLKRNRIVLTLSFQYTTKKQNGELRMVYEYPISHTDERKSTMHHGNESNRVI